MRGHLRQARNDCTAVLGLNPVSTIALVNRGALRYLLGDAEGSLHDLGEAIRLDPRCALAYFDRGVIFLERSAFAAAEADFRRAITHGGGDAELYTNRGIARYGLGKFVPAVRDFGRAVGLDPGAFLARYYRALVNGRHGDPRSALADLDACLSRSPADWPLRPEARRLRSRLA